MQPLFIGPYDVGTQKNLKPFMIPEKAFETITNATVYRGRVQRKRGYSLLGRLRRNLTAQALANTSAAATYTNGGTDILTTLSLRATEPNASITPGTAVITIDSGGASHTVVNDNGNGTLSPGVPNNLGATGGTIIYGTGASPLSSTISITFAAPIPGALAVIITFSYYPALPVMGLLNRELTTINNEFTVAFDTKYAYRYIANWSELPSTLVTTWSGQDYELFWGTNYARNATNNDLFWVTNNNIGLHGYAVTLFGGAAAGPPSTVAVTAAGNTFQVGDTVFFVNLAGAGAANNLTTGTVTIAGNPFTISNPGTGIFANGVVTGLALSPNRNTNGDGIRFYNGTSWANLNPAVNGTTAVMGALMILPFKDRLVLLNTFEGNSLTPTAVNFPQRARWSQNGTPLDFAQGWRDDIAGRGGFVDAPTSERIISANYLKDQVIVYFERSTWALVYTGNEVLPFVWQKINTELGAESTFSNIPFDNSLIAFGNVGLHACNGVSVERIDEVIPDVIFTVQNGNNGVKRVAAIRDNYNELAYFSYTEFQPPGFDYETKFPNKILVYNYRNDTFSFFNDSFTCYGNFQRVTSLTWASLTLGTEYAPWSSWASAWNSATGQAEFLDTAAGNQQGFVLKLNPDEIGSAPSLQITNISGTTITSPVHNMAAGTFIRIEDCLGITNLNNQIFQVKTVTANTFTIITAGTGGPYLGGGVIRPLPNINIKTKMFNPFWDSASRYRLVKAEYLFDRTDEGSVTVNVFDSTDDSFSMTDVTTNTSLLGTPIVSTAPEPGIIFQQTQASIWHRQYYFTEGDTFQFQITMSDAQMLNFVTAESDIVLSGMVMHFEKAGEFL